MDEVEKALADLNRAIAALPPKIGVTVSAIPVERIGGLPIYIVHAAFIQHAGTQKTPGKAD